MSIIKRAFINPNKCKECKECSPLLNCPASAITLEDEDDPPYVEPTCVGCAKCTKLCPYQAIAMI